MVLLLWISAVETSGDEVSAPLLEHLRNEAMPAWAAYEKRVGNISVEYTYTILSRE
ncbi:MAG: hypothetical protein H0T47_08300 [Planctomycetaceae bacterium]|nr:hypothetical protein [Planctomycetaceae bacterium]